MAEEVKLYGVWASPFTRRVEIALKLKGVDYKYFEEDLSKKSPSLLKYNPVHKKIPVFVHNERAIAESLVIVEYIDETWDNSPILPKDPFQRAQARFWARFIDEKCSPAIWKALWTKEDREKNVEEVTELLKFLENELKDKKFFGGETVGLADISGNFIAYWLRPVHEVAELEILTEEKFLRLFRWSDEFSNHKVVKQGLPPKDKIKPYFSARFGGGSSNSNLIISNNIL